MMWHCFISHSKPSKVYHQTNPMNFMKKNLPKQSPKIVGWHKPTDMIE